MSMWPIYKLRHQWYAKNTGGGVDSLYHVQTNVSIERGVIYNISRYTIQKGVLNLKICFENKCASENKCFVRMTIFHRIFVYIPAFILKV